MQSDCILICDAKLFTLSGMVQRTHVSKIVLAVVVMAIGAGISIPLGRYAERDDAPGGVLIAALIFIGATLFAARIVYQRP